ncbi:type IV pilus modification protein PilV [Endozoicomonas sp. OPT23]|uniref:type IV pilus modification protein PilV n=1 Tax=Endozoicomonas sp. OPT23 TaxID=2072845 RepID=UPI00129B146A|nr:type IV pilus modification protein PilV [Endozoicomonas sp. OPT23]MRI33721.1 type IV pilus modification protein PilV [Endozoicomonas sp. OPT23]
MPILKKQKGFTLIEVMVAVLILSIGLLGMAGLQVLSMQSSTGALQRSQATMLAYDLAERIRRNRDGALNGDYDRVIKTTNNEQDSAPTSPACILAGCTSTELAEQDIREWLDNIIDVTGIGNDGNNWQPTLPESTAVLIQDDNEFNLNIRWQVSDSAQQNEIQKNYNLTFTL